MSDEQLRFLHNFISNFIVLFIIAFAVTLCAIVIYKSTPPTEHEKVRLGGTFDVGTRSTDKAEE